MNNVPTLTKEQILAQKTLMGGTESYISSVTLEWLAKRVNFAANFSLLSQQNEVNLENIKQRPLDWSRQASLTQYLVERKYHKFPPVLVVISQDWVNNNLAEQWDHQGRSLTSSAEFSPINETGDLGLLNVGNNVTIFALDGQHRLMGVQGLMELINTGKLCKYHQNIKTNHSIMNAENFDLNYLKNLAEENIGIEFISAVVPGETYIEASRRIRSIFVHVNLMAVPLSKGQLAQLDENNGFAIIARKIAINHPLFQEKLGQKSLIEWHKNNITAKSNVLTTLQALKEMSELYLQYKFPHWKKVIKKGLVPLRPENYELEEGVREFNQLFDELSTLFSYQRLEVEETPKLRRFSSEKNGGEGNILFRPVGQIALINALGIMIYKKQVNIQIIFDKLRSYDQDGIFSNIELPSSIFYGILYDPNKKRIMVSGKNLATKLIVYLLGGIDDTMEKAELRRLVAKARTIEGKAIGFDGQFTDPKKVGLPLIKY